MFHIGSDTLCVATQKSGDTLAAPLPTMSTRGPVQNESDTPDTVSDISDSIPDNVPDMNGH